MANYEIPPTIDTTHETPNKTDGESETKANKNTMKFLNFQVMGRKKTDKKAEEESQASVCVYLDNERNAK